MSSIEKKYCHSCGQTLESAAAFCPGCGRAQPSAAKPAYSEKVDSQTNLDVGTANPYVAPTSAAYSSYDALGSTGEERNWAMGCHLASLVGYLIPLGNFLGPLIVWMTQREKFPLVDDQGKESLNFQITMTIMFVVSGILFCVGIGVVLFPVVIVYDLVLTIMASVKASQGERYRYPMTIRFIT